MASRSHPLSGAARSLLLLLLAINCPAVPGNDDPRAADSMSGFATSDELYLIVGEPMTDAELRLLETLKSAVRSAMSGESAPYTNKFELDAETILGVYISNRDVVLVNMDMSAISSVFTVGWGPEMEDMASAIAYEADRIYVEHFARSCLGTLVVFAGRSGMSYDPTYNDVLPSQGAPRTQGAAPVAEVPATSVLLSAGHGLYYHLGQKAWRYQREEINGILEDTLTPKITEQLQTHLSSKSRSDATTHLARHLINTQIHEPTQRPWWEVSARYHLQQTLPENSKIWDSYKPPVPLNEYKDDIRSRPLYANHLGVNAFIGIHTNAGGGKGSGSLTIYNSKTGQPDQSRSLATSISCYMKELIHSLDRYADFPIAEPRMENLKGEIGLASMPAVIVEVAFHDNPNDAEALKDQAFITAATKGIEKGYRMYGQGSPCQPLNIRSIENSSAAWPEWAEVNVEYDGYPMFPVEIDVEVLNCPPEWVCIEGDEATLVFNTLGWQGKNPLVYSYRCDDYSSTPVTLTLRTTMRDDDDVETTPIDHQITCNPPA